MTTSGEPPRSVLARYGPALAGLQWTPVPGGFSGAAVWRGDDTTGPVFALKAWQPEATSERLVRVHGWMARAAYLPFVPNVLPTADGTTVVGEAGRVWDVTRWMPGQ